MRNAVTGARKRLSAAACAAALLAAACATTTRSGDAESLRAAYAAAVLDAEQAEPREVDRRLRAVRADEPGLEWDGAAGASRIKVVTWTAAPIFDRLDGTDVALDGDRWVTLVPDLQRACSRLHGPVAEREMRLRQLLGLPPDAKKDRFVELWARPQDLFRPCPDPEIHDRECAPAAAHPGKWVTIDPAYAEWFEKQRESSYAKPPATPYPWTRLGYTYDWGGPHGEIGLSELVVARGATVGVVRVADFATYCGVR